MYRTESVRSSCLSRFNFKVTKSKDPEIPKLKKVACYVILADQFRDRRVQGSKSQDQCIAVHLRVLSGLVSQ